jgi:hypothetical protein
MHILEYARHIALLANTISFHSHCLFYPVQPRFAPHIPEGPLHPTFQICLSNWIGRFWLNDIRLKEIAPYRRHDIGCVTEGQSGGLRAESRVGSHNLGSIRLSRAGSAAVGMSKGTSGQGNNSGDGETHFEWLFWY